MIRGWDGMRTRKLRKEGRDGGFWRRHSDTSGADSGTNYREAHYRESEPGCECRRTPLATGLAAVVVVVHARVGLTCTSKLS